MFDVNFIDSGAIHYSCSSIGLVVIYFVKTVINLHCLRKFIVLFGSTARYGSTNAKHDRQWTYSRNIVVQLCKYCWRRKTVNCTNPEWVFLALNSQYAKCICHVILCVRVWLYHIFPHYLKHDTISRKECLINKFTIWSCLQNRSVTFLILRRIQQVIVLNILLPFYKAPVILGMFSQTWTSPQFWKNFSDKKFFENSSNAGRGVRCGWTDGQNDEPSSHFPKICE